ncbi:MAG TPA: orotidine-5'-phosphate decarboxylase [Bryobacteraceae bacterium]|jgi:orotidine-5'-phosphate decarboxylase|nr:orotidine-5'-phosphate decarboxylase [Bryobacteraceae bacterium]
MNNSPIIIALDVPSANEARALVSSLGVAADFYKVGLELYAAEGMDFVRELKGQGKRVFLDLKLYDIGEQVKRAVKVIASSGADFLTVHAVKPVMQAAVEGRGDSLKLLAVTVLTSFDEQDVRDDGSALTLAALVEKRVGHAIAAGMNGIVCSSLEIAKVRAIAPKMTLVIPGVRSVGKSTGDQKRVATPADAIASGADFLVVGRQVTRADDPRGELLKILDEIHTFK